MIRRVLFGWLAVVLLAPGGARAADHVVGPTPGGWELTARDHPGGTLCAQLREGGKVAEEGCGVSADPGEVLVLGLGAELAGVAGTDVAAVEVEYPDGARQSVQTVGDGAYHGVHAGQQRWYLADPVQPRAPFLIRAVAADGRVLSVSQPGGNVAVHPLRRLARGRTPGGHPWTVRLRTERSLSPVADIPDRVVTRRCVGVAVAPLTSYICDAVEPLLRPTLTAFPFPLGDGGRETTLRALLGWAGHDVAAVKVLLGSGQRVGVALHERAFGYVLPPHEALIAVEALDAAGKIVGRTEPRVSPANLPGDVELGERTTPLAAPPAPVKPVADGFALREVGDWLCGEVGAFVVRDGSDPCTLVEKDSVLFVGGAQGDRWIVGGAVPANVVTAQVRAFGEPASSTVTVRTIPYEGRWHDHLRLFTAAVDLNAVTVVLRDAAGKQIGPRWSVDFVDGVPIEAGLRRVHGGPLRRSSTCTGLGEVVACYAGTNVLSSCRVRRVAVIFPFRRRPGARVVTSDGRVHRPFRDGRGSRARWVYVAPRGLGVRLVRWRGGRVRLGAVPPATRQCGFLTQPDSRD